MRKMLLFVVVLGILAIMLAGCVDPTKTKTPYPPPNTDTPAPYPIATDTQSPYPYPPVETLPYPPAETLVPPSPYPVVLNIINGEESSKPTASYTETNTVKVREYFEPTLSYPYPEPVEPTLLPYPYP